jgi:hypothetical protein
MAHLESEHKMITKTKLSKPSDCCWIAMSKLGDDGLDSEKVPAVKRGLLEVLATAATQSKAGQSMGAAREQLGQERHPLTVLLFRAVVARTNFQVFRMYKSLVCTDSGSSSRSFL